MPNPPPQQGKNQSIQLRAATAIRAQSIGENFNTALYPNFTNTFFGDHIETRHAPHTGGKFWGDDRFSVGFNDHVKFATLKSKCRLSLTIAGSPSYLIATDEPTTGL